MEADHFNLQGPLLFPQTSKIFFKTLTDSNVQEEGDSGKSGCEALTLL